MTTMSDTEWWWRREEESFFPEAVEEFEMDSDSELDEDEDDVIDEIVEYLPLDYEDLEDVPLRLAPDEDEPAHQLLSVDLESVGNVIELEDENRNVLFSDVNLLNDVQSALGIGLGFALGFGFGFGFGFGSGLPDDSTMDQQVPDLHLDLNGNPDLHRAHPFKDEELTPNEELDEPGRHSLPPFAHPGDSRAHPVHSSSSS